MACRYQHDAIAWKQCLHAVHAPACIAPHAGPIRTRHTRRARCLPRTSGMAYARGLRTPRECAGRTTRSGTTLPRVSLGNATCRRHRCGRTASTLRYAILNTRRANLLMSSSQRAGSLTFRIVSKESYGTCSSSRRCYATNAKTCGNSQAFKHRRPSQIVLGGPQEVHAALVVPVMVDGEAVFDSLAWPTQRWTRWLRVQKCF